MNSVNDLADRYVAIWNEPDPDRSRDPRKRRPPDLRRPTAVQRRSQLGL
jgi:hypothetical protein